MVLLTLLLFFLVPDWWERMVYPRKRDRQAPLERSASPTA
jgi:hypothetical protein